MKNIILGKINKFLGINLSELYKENENKILENFKKYPIPYLESNRSII